ncbi:hypothetical protein, partial [Limosilactobacillus fermentum]
EAIHPPLVEVGVFTPIMDKRKEATECESVTSITVQVTEGKLVVSASFFLYRIGNGAVLNDLAKCHDN